MSVIYAEFQITASGFGCVNTNGGMNPKTGREGSDDGFKNRIFAKQRGGQMYISANCIRGHFFEPDARGMMLTDRAGWNNNKGERGELVIGKNDMPRISQMMAGSYLGQVRGYMFTEKGAASIHRSTSLTVVDWVNQIGEPNANEVMVNHLAVDGNGKKESNSLFYQDTWGSTFYEGDAVLSIENLQFISMDNRLGQQAVRFNENPKKMNIKSELDAFVDDLVNNLRKIGRLRGMSEATCELILVEQGLFIRSGTLFEYPEEGLLLSDAAIHALVLETKYRFEEFKIVKSKGFVRVEGVKTNLTTKFCGEGLEQATTPNDIPNYKCFYEKYEPAAQEA